MALVAGTNSYGTRAEADAYFNDSLRSEIWASFATSKRDQALIEATRILERIPYNGTKTSPSQTLEFSREGLSDVNGIALTGAETLAIMKEAEFEYAVFLLGKPAAINEADSSGRANVKSVGAGSAKVAFFRPLKGVRFPISIRELIGTFISGAGSLTATVVSGTGGTTTFDQDYGTTKGYP
jgi:hypothetical protein